MTPRVTPDVLITPGLYRVSSATGTNDFVIVSQPRPHPKPADHRTDVVDTITIPGGRRQERQLHTLGLVPHPKRGEYVADITFVEEPEPNLLGLLKRAAYYTSTPYKEYIAKRLARHFLWAEEAGWCTRARINTVWVYGGIAIGKEPTRDIDLGLFVDPETTLRNIQLPLEGRQVLAISSGGQRLRDDLVEVLGLTEGGIDHIEWLLRGEQTKKELEQRLANGDFTAELRAIDKLDIQIWSNPMPPHVRRAYNAAARALGNDPKFPQRMASRLRFYDNDRDAFDPISAHPVDLGRPE